MQNCANPRKKPIADRFFILAEKRIRLSLALSVGLILPTAASGQEAWTLESAVRRFLEVAPETREAAAMVSAREGALVQAGRWPNPRIEFQADDRIGKDSGTGGTDFTAFAFSQPVPLSGRIGRRKDIAEAELAVASQSRRYQMLRMEVEAARAFHLLQFTSAKLSLAEERLTLTDELRAAGQRRAEAGDIAPLAQLRLDIIRESAEQAIDIAEGEFSEVLAQFNAILGLPADAAPAVAPLAPYEPIPALDVLEAELRNHPAVSAEDARVEAARSGVALARSERWPDPEIRVFRERDFLNGRRQDVTGVGVGITIPFWDWNSGRIRESRARENQALAKVQIAERDIANRLRTTHLHLTHLVHQVEDYRTRVLGPAERLFELTSKAYAAGEAEILGLIDANDTYFDSRIRYLELLEEAWLEAADLRLAAGRSVLADNEGANP